MKRAVIDIAPEILREVLPVLEDAGLDIVASLNNPYVFKPCVRLIVMGDALPEECNEDRDLSIVEIILFQDEQRLAKIKKIRIVCPYAGSLSVPEKEAIK